ncbi:MULTISPECIES: FecCD family ABC transporter permease [Methanosarcina]|uniref:Cobalamin import system permease protein BtuC n=3 Tax=Methanosarcina barkeri TaxID=2208 RepID=A0A0E3QYW7_METBA|nr:MULTISPECIES: iron ABC transporter permease [Methanosarcina]AKB56079.1 Vitamin B12 ABC transporter, permease component BtuC [Methanosarcina barkeri MS]AKJ40213.1 iron ABC transporter permease protein [Methanosarcina barkeri CM1]OEC90060.1 ABC transporter permease [Methanosarcina sp. A14]
MPDYKFNRTTLVYLLPIALLIISLFIGRYQTPLSAVVDESMKVFSSLFFGTPISVSTQHTVLFNVRLPRILAALLVGAALSIAGASFQGIFRNPLVSPYILGVGSGAGFGACLAILLWNNYLMIQLTAFAFGLLAMFIAISMGKVSKGTGTLVFVLSGIIVSSIFTALTSLAKYVADPYDQLPEIVFWLMGSLASVRYGDLLYILLPIFIGTLVLFLFRWRINILSLGDEEAKALGTDVEKTRLVIIVCATLVTSAAVSISGVIGWVGLVVPHISRMIVGPNYSRLLPMSMIIGASFMLVVDDLSRTIVATEIPLGILTSLVGAPVFAYLIKKGRMGWN